ncbi:MAG: anaerobic carbon-monoxide dehydrogenase catalytic subunit [Actinobacteria bacterium]|nr:anaerobic carbon-monoxide dehydrogenase catalytic subunit [Actinomycetota bacterium]
MSDEKKKKGNDYAKSIDPAALEMLQIADEKGISTMFSRVDEVSACPIGAEGACCKICFMGPCRFVGKEKEQKHGVCGANLATVAARNFIRSCAGGASAHADHGRTIAETLLMVGKGEAADYRVKDPIKLRTVAGYFDIPVEGKDDNQLAVEVATAALNEWGKQNEHQIYAKRAPKKRQELWEKLGVTPRGFDREVVDSMHRTHAGGDQDAQHIMDQCVRMCLASGWGGSMLATDISDILWGTPRPLTSEANLGVLNVEDVNIIIHGHEPVLSEMIVDASQDREIIEYAKSKGAAGITLAGICCTANEIWMRRGVPPAGNSLHQELALLTGAVELMVTDIQCVFQGLVGVAKNFHTHVVTTSQKAHIEGATRVEFHEDRALEIAKDIVRMAIDNYENRDAAKVHIPNIKSPVVAGFSHEYIRYMLGGKYRGSFQPLNDNIINGKIQGAVAIVGCNNPRSTQDEGIINLVKNFIENDVLVLVTGCAAHAAGKHGFLTPEMFENAGPGLSEVCETTGMPPVLHVGSCVDNTRILTILTDIVETGGLGDDIDQVPAVGISPEYYCEKALEIATYCVGSGAYVIFGGVESPVRASGAVTDIHTSGWEEQFGGKLEFISDWQGIFEASMAHIRKKREALGIHEAQERVLFDMADRRG